MTAPPLHRFRGLPSAAGPISLVCAALLAGCGDAGARNADRDGAVPEAGGKRTSDEAPAAAVRGGESATERARRTGFRGLALASPLPKPDLVLTDTEGGPFHLRERTEGKVTLLFFGYTHCPDVCPVQLANLGAVLEELRPSVRGSIRVVFVTVDPERDTPERIRAWLDRFGSGFTGLRGPLARVQDVQRSLGLPAAVPLPDTVGGVATMGHASQILAFGKDGTARLAYPFGTRQADWAHDLPRLVAGRVPHTAGASGPGTGSGAGR